MLASYAIHALTMKFQSEASHYDITRSRPGAPPVVASIKVEACGKIASIIIFTNDLFINIKYCHRHKLLYY